MKSIVLTSKGREINISSLLEVDSIHDIINELIIPALQASGFSADVIMEGFEGCLQVHYPEVEKTCDTGCGKPASQFFCDDCASTHCIVTLDTVIKGNGEVPDADEQKDEKSCETCVNFHHPVCAESQINREYCIGAGRISWRPLQNVQVLQALEEDEKEPEIFTCDNCGNDFSPDQFNNDHFLCESCYSSHICADCGNSNDDCQCEDPIETPKQVWESRPHSDVWSTAGQSRSEPEAVSVWDTGKEDVPAPLNRHTASIPVHTPESPIDRYNLTPDQRKANIEKCKAQLSEVQELSDKGLWRLTENRIEHIRCSNVRRFFPDIDCRISCSTCPIGGKVNKSRAMEYGYYYCNICESVAAGPFPLGYCPSCGLHPGEDNRKGLHEFCGDHWDVNRAKDGYLASGEENWTDDNPEDEPDDDYDPEYN